LIQILGALEACAAHKSLAAAIQIAQLMALNNGCRCDAASDGRGQRIFPIFPLCLTVCLAGEMERDT